MKNLLIAFFLCGGYCIGCVPKGNDGISESTDSMLITNEDTVKYESIFDPTNNFEVRHYFQSEFKDSLFVYFKDSCIYQFFCRVEDEEMGYFVKDGISKVSDEGIVATGDLLESDSVLYIPLTMSFNGWYRIFTFDLRTRKEIFHLKENKKFDVYSRGHTYLKNGLIYCLQGVKIDTGYVNTYKIRDNEYVLKKISKYKSEEYTDSIIMKDIIR